VYRNDPLVSIYRFLRQPGIATISVIITFTLFSTVPTALSAESLSSEKLGFSNREQWRNWKKITFPDVSETKFQFHADSGAVCGNASQSASGMARAFQNDSPQKVLLSWEWRIRDIIQKAKGRGKPNDDYPARVYANFKRTGDRFSLWEQTLASTFEMVYGREIPGQSLNFVWANAIDRGEYFKSPFTRHSRVIVLESGNQNAGKWKKERVRVGEWYRKVFGDGEIPPIQSVAIMVDSDNSSSKARGCFRNVQIHTK